jgi:transaldolase
MSTLPDYIQEIIFKNIDLNRHHEFPSDLFWGNLKNTGTELWLDTGDIGEAEKIWTREMTALTTNNTLLNNEIQKGIYDDLIQEANRILTSFDLPKRVLGIAFILNARHGLRLVERFGGKVSVELHTDLAHDLEGIVAYGQRFHEISPDHFIVKVPYTSTGLLGARKLRQLGISVNFTLEFSARQNAVVAAVVKPDYLNVFLGRLNAFVADNNLGDGRFAGEKATWASQQIVKSLTRHNDVPTKLIAASMRGADQLESLAGIDVFTIPVKVAAEGRRQLSGEFSPKTNEQYEVTLNDSVSPNALRIENLWEVTGQEKTLALTLDVETPGTGKALETMAHQLGCGDMFPQLSREDMARIAIDGKIPVYKKWARRIEKGEIAIDTLMNLAGLASFTSDQRALDERILKLIS